MRAPGEPGEVPSPRPQEGSSGILKENLGGGEHSGERFLTPGIFLPCRGSSASIILLVSVCHVCSQRKQDHLDLERETGIAESRCPPLSSEGQPACRRCSGPPNQDPQGEVCRDTAQPVTGWTVYSNPGLVRGSHLFADTVSHFSETDPVTDTWGIVFSPSAGIFIGFLKGSELGQKGRGLFWGFMELQ